VTVTVSPQEWQPISHRHDSESYVDKRWSSSCTSPSSTTSSRVVPST
jgi:hypothetical protein